MLSDNVHTFYIGYHFLQVCLYYIYLELHKCTVTSVSELAHLWGVFQYTVYSLTCYVKSLNKAMPMPLDFT